MNSDLIERQRQKFRQFLEPALELDCPICDGYQSFICQIVEKDLDEGRVSLSRAICLECDLVIRNDTPFLANAICKDQIDAKREEILHDFGI